MIGKKIVCMRKNAEINCLPRGASRKKLSAETTYVMQDLGNFLKNCLHIRSGGKKLASAQSMVEKISCLPEITIPPPGRTMTYYNCAKFRSRGVFSFEVSRGGGGRGQNDPPLRH